MEGEKKGGVAVMVGMGGMSNEVRFPVPEGMDVSEMEEGDEKEILAVVCYCGDGEFKLVSVDGYPLSEDEEEMPEGYDEEMEMEEESYPQQLQSRAGLS